jgi:hypothetical protein
VQLEVLVSPLPPNFPAVPQYVNHPSVEFQASHGTGQVAFPASGSSTDQINSFNLQNSFWFALEFF